MPIRLDHDEQRREITRAAADAIAEFGVERVRLTDIARVAGCTTGRLAHYYAGKEELLLDTWRYTRSLGRERITQALAGDDDDLFGLVEAMLPMDAEGVMRWRVTLAVTERALRDPAVAAERISADQQLITLIASTVRRWADRRGLAVDDAGEARTLWALCWGVGTESLCNPTDWPPEAMRATLRRWLERLGESASRAR